MRITPDEIRLEVNEAVALLDRLAPLSDPFVNAVAQKIQEQIQDVVEGRSSNFYVNIEIYDY